MVVHYPQNVYECRQPAKAPGIWVLWDSLKLAAEPALRRCTIRQERKKLSGRVEVDKFFIGGQKSDPRGRGAQGKTIVAVGVERWTWRNEWVAFVCTVPWTARRIPLELYHASCGTRQHHRHRCLTHVTTSLPTMGTFMNARTKAKAWTTKTSTALTWWHLLWSGWFVVPFKVDLNPNIFKTIWMNSFSVSIAEDKKVSGKSSCSLYKKWFVRPKSYARIISGIWSHFRSISQLVLPREPLKI
jgi:hypothetical protein